jgi:uncharacterized membrane protein
LARAKNTDRAEARRRHREQTRAVEETPAAGAAAATAEAVAPEPSPSLGGALRTAFRFPDIRADLRILPGMLLHTKKLWIPFIALGVAFVLALMLAQTKSSTVILGGTLVSLEYGRVLPPGIDNIVALFVQLTLPPTALFVFFVGGFLAPRASYLVGAVLGLVDGLLWSLLFILAPGAQPDQPGRATNTSDYLAIILIAVVVGTLAAGFASWYRNFLRQSQERARQNRMAREQQMRAKAKEDERKAREEQRRAAAAARQAPKSTASASAPTGGKGSAQPPATR